MLLGVVGTSVRLALTAPKAQLLLIHAQEELTVLHKA